MLLQTTNLDAALDIASRGFPVFPYHPVRDGQCSCNSGPNCGSAGKHPWRTGWQSLATTDPEIIREWWTQTPDAGIGISTHGLIIVDIDGTAAHERFQQWQQEHGFLPKTYRVNSGNTEPDRYQLYYRAPDGMRAMNKPLLGIKGIDIKSGYAGQVAAPGNLHRCGRRYAWDLEESLGEPESVADLPPAPSCLLLCVELVPEGQEPAPASKRKGRPRKSSRKPNDRADSPKPVDKEYFEHGTDGEILTALHSRFPISGPGTRHSACLQAVAYLLAVRKVTPLRTQYLLGEYLFRCQDEYEATLEVATARANAMVWSLLGKIQAGEFQVAVDHDELAAGQELCPVLQAYFDNLVCPQSVPTTPRPPKPYGGRDNNNNPPKTTRYERLTTDEQNLVYSILLRYQYEVYYHQEPGEFKFVESQILNVMKARFGRCLGRTKWKELKDKFFGGKRLKGEDRKPALELFRCIKTGNRRGQPSVYVPVNVPKLNLSELELKDVHTLQERRSEWRASESEPDPLPTVQKPEPDPPEDRTPAGQPDSHLPVPELPEQSSPEHHPGQRPDHHPLAAAETHRHRAGSPRLAPGPRLYPESIPPGPAKPAPAGQPLRQPAQPAAMGMSAQQLPQPPTEPGLSAADRNAETPDLNSITEGKSRAKR